MCDAAGTETWGYDQMNRVTSDQRTTNGVTKTVSYTYYLDGTLKTLTYPSGRVVNYQVGGAELPTQATDAGSGVNYASGVTYAPERVLATASLAGGNINLAESYSSRLQPSTIQAVSASATDLLDLAYDFALGTADNGNVKAIVNNRDNTRTQYFDYDALNRITLANTQASTGANAWGQAFGYDPWGNLTSVTVTQGSAPALSVAVNANNQLAGSPYSYDAAGNMLTDAVNTYTWNAEGKMASSSGSFGSANYVYDGDGKRVEKSSGKLYWYGTDGNVLSESDASGNITDDYILFGGKRLTRVDAHGNVDYYLSDALGSSRVVTDSNGNILDDCDFLPFGDEQCVASSSGNMYKFTGKERDSESGLDNFGARYYTSTMDRFMSPDPLLNSGRPWDPQSWNGYSYVLNNPTTRTDPEGTNVDVCVNTGGSNNNQTCVRLTDPQYAELLHQQNGKQGIGLPTGNFPTGNITCGGQVCGTASYYEQGLQDQTVNLLAFAGLAEGVARGAMALGEEGISALGRMIGIGAEETGGVVESEASATGEAVVASGAKAVVRDAIDNGPFNSAVKSNLKRQLRAIGNNATVTVERLPDGSARISWARPGFEGSQKFVKLVDSSGRTVSVTQYGYDSAGSVVHVDRKF